MSTGAPVELPVPDGARVATVVERGGLPVAALVHDPALVENLERWPEVGILVLSQHVRASYAVELLAQGSAGIGYLLKERVSDLSEFAASVERVAHGDSVLDPLVVEQLVGRPRHGHDPLEHLTEREREVPALMAEGRSNRAIAGGWSSPSTRSKSTSSTSSPPCAWPPSPDDHRRVLAAVSYLNAQHPRPLPAGRTSKECGCPAVPGSLRPAGSNT
jgi:hypothetical protein